MVVIRLSRGGAKKAPFYQVVVADSRCKRDGRFIEKVGYYNPIASGQAVPLSLNLEVIDSWISKGARVTDTVHNLIQRARKAQRLSAQQH